MYKRTERFFDFWDAIRPSKTGIYQAQKGEMGITAYDQAGKVLGTLAGVSWEVLERDPAVFIRGYRDGVHCTMVRFNLSRAFPIQERGLVC